MNIPTHFLVLYLIAALAAIFWLCGLAFLLHTTSRTAAATPELWEEEEGLPPAPGDGTVRGTAEVAGKPADLAAKAAAHLAQHGLGQLGPVKILEQADDRVAFEALPGLGGRCLRRGVLELRPVGADHTQIDFAVLIPRRSGLLASAWVVQILGLVVLIAGFLVIHLWVAPHPNPAVHWQSAQMAQVVHFLWPPFLFGAIYRRVQTLVRTTMDSLVSNLPYLKG